MTIQQAQLIKRTAWQNTQPRTPSEEDKKYIPDAIKMLTLVACLNYAGIDLEEALVRRGLYRHGLKHRVKQATSVIASIHGEAYTMLCRISSLAGRQYNDALDKAFSDIQSAVLLTNSPEREYNILVALCRLVEVYNKRLSGRYDFYPARQIYRLPALLEGIAHDYRIDIIIDKAI